MGESVTWEKLAEWAKEIFEKQIEPSESEIKEYARYLDDYIGSCSKKVTTTDKVKWLTGNIKNGYKMDESFYKRTISLNDGKVLNRPLTSPSVTILCYRISEMEQCSAEEVCNTLITLRLFSEGTEVDQDILRRLKGVPEEKEDSDSERIEKSVLNNQGGYDLPENSMDDAELPEDNVEDKGLHKNGVNVAGLSVGNDKCKKDSIEKDAKNVQLDVSQYTDKDNIPEIMEDDLKKFVTGFIGIMSYKIEAIYPREHSNYSELFSIYLDESCVDELSIFHQHIKPWKCVLVTYFPSGTRDEEIQQEIERIHKLDKNSRAFVIVACATDEMLRYARKIVACGRQKSIMLLCYEHQDEAYICLKENSKSDKMRFEFLKPDSKEYFYK